MPLLALRRTFVRRANIVNGQREVREERKEGRESKDKIISYCGMDVSQGPFNCSLSSTLSLPSHPTPALDNLCGNWSETRELFQQQIESKEAYGAKHELGKR